MTNTTSTLGNILNQGFVELVEQAHLVKVNKLDTTEKGDPFLRCTGLSPDENGELTSRLVVNVFPGAGMISLLGEVIKANGMLLVFGQISIGDSDYGTQIRSINDARMATFDSEGSFELDGGKMEGTPGAMVVIPIHSKATLKMLEMVQDRPPARRTVELKARHERRTMGKTPEQTSTV